MRILSMTATFGSLAGKTLTLEPGLNIISAPNEWGKSTWCAFLMAMLYGVDTRQRTKQGSLADKEHYMPWSGKPMAGKVRLLWQERDITIERYTQGRIPMGKFRAYETESGLEVPELTADNCGTVLLGVERGVYARSGFISDSSMVVGSDADLSRRLNQLVTTGDDSPVGVNLERQLRELKNKCQYNRSGLLPQAREALELCRKDLAAQEGLGRQAQELHRELEGVKSRQAELQAHRGVLEAAENKAKLAHVAEARRDEEEAAVLLRGATEQCERLPSPEELRRGLRELEKLQQERASLEMGAAMAEPVREAPIPPAFAGLSPAEAVEKADRDVAELEELEEKAQKKRGIFWFITAPLILAAGVAAWLLLPAYVPWWAAAGAGLISVLCLILGFAAQKRRGRARRELELYRRGLETEYRGCDPVELAKTFSRETMDAAARKEERDKVLRQALEEISQREKALGVDERVWKRALEVWEDWADAQRRYIRAEKHRRAMEHMAAGLRGTGVPEGTKLNLTMEQTLRELEKLNTRIGELRSRLDACLGQSKALPAVSDLQLKEKRLQERVEELEKWYAAIVCALELLGQAQRELQSRFAPKISRRAAEILSGFTQGRYEKLLLQEDFSLLTAAEGETVNRESRWRSMGTQEQMYLALRLAVADVLMPEAPLILDDALVRFDDRRMERVLEFLARQERQVILLSCQSREKDWQTRHRAGG